MGGVHAGEMRDIHGRVIDESGMPVAGADVSFFWTANGPLEDRNGKQYDLESVEGRKDFSANLGKMFPLGDVERFTTWERFGLPGLGTVILIDPEGKLMKGDESVLAEKLK